MLDVQNVDTCYGEFRVLDNVSLRVAEGEVVGIIGPNGHGKSTLLKTICGLIPASRGLIRFDGEDIGGLPTHRIVEMGLVYVAEARHLFPEMTVLENLKLGAYNRKARRKERENLDYVFGLFPKLSERKNQLASTLSGGEARMLAIGRGLMASARFIAIDEPSLGLAPNLIMELFDKISEINSNGITLLVVEQTVMEAMELVNRIYLLEDGCIVFEGNKEETMSNDYVKEAFLGL